MANDGRPSEEQEEREFLAGLKPRTGRDLAEWMAAIAAQGFHDKNEIIDWLRTQGFPFARASWLERIHRNGGKPIHAGASRTGSSHATLAQEQGGPTVIPGRPVAPPRLEVVASTPRPVPSPPPAASPPPRPQQPVQPAQVAAAQSPPPPAHPAATAAAGPPGAGGSDANQAKPTPKPARKSGKLPPPVEPSADPGALEKLVAAAKGYRPLYHHLEAQIRRAIPGVVVAARDRYVAVGAPLEFAAVTLHPTEVRLGLALGDRPFDARLQEAKLRGPGGSITHMLILTDARQVNDELLSLIRAAHARVNGS